MMLKFFVHKASHCSSLMPLALGIPLPSSLCPTLADSCLSLRPPFRQHLLQKSSLVPSVGENELCHFHASQCASFHQSSCCIFSTSFSLMDYDLLEDRGH